MIESFDVCSLFGKFGHAASLLCQHFPEPLRRGCLLWKFEGEPNYCDWLELISILAGAVVFDGHLRRRLYVGIEAIAATMNFIIASVRAFNHSVSCVWSHSELVSRLPGQDPIRNGLRARELKIRADLSENQGSYE